MLFPESQNLSENTPKARRNVRSRPKKSWKTTYQTYHHFYQLTSWLVLGNLLCCSCCEVGRKPDCINCTSSLRPTEEDAICQKLTTGTSTTSVFAFVACSYSVLPTEVLVVLLLVLAEVVTVMSAACVASTAPLAR